MATSPLDLHRWTRQDKERMAEAGFFGPEERVELVDGVIYDMTCLVRSFSRDQRGP